MFNYRDVEHKDQSGLLRSEMAQTEGGVENYFSGLRAFFASI